MVGITGERYMIEQAPGSRINLSYDEAVLYCQFLDYNGHQDWRLPTYKEWKDSPGLVGWYLDRDPTFNLTAWMVIPVRDI